MSRSAEEQLLLDERIQAMKRKNEELRRRHMEVEADKQTAAKQNALVKMNVAPDDDWVPGRVVENPRPQQHQEPLSPSGQDRNDERSQWPDQRRNRQFDEGSAYPKQNQQNFSGRRGDYQGNRQRSDGDWSHSTENRRSGDWSNRSNDGGGRSREWGPQSNRGFRNNPPSGSGDGTKGYPTTFTSKVFKNSSMDPDRGKRAGYRLAEGDGPPPDPSYSFLGDSMRDSPESGDKRRGNPRRGFPRSRGRGGGPWNNRGFNESQSGDAEDRPETQTRNQDDPKQDEWRRERSKIDQERINRQKTSDGNWSREWDNNKVLQDSADRPHRWRRGNQNQNQSYGYNQPRRGFHENSNNSPKQGYGPRGDAPSAVEKGEDSRPPFGRRGRFTHQQRFKDNPRFSNGSSQQATLSETDISKESSDATLIESNVTSVEKLQVSLVCDASGAQRRSVEGLGGNLLLNVSRDEDSSDGKATEQKRQPRKIRKAKRNRIFSTTSTGTAGTTEEDNNESWEDLSSEEEAVSVLTELSKVPRSDTAKSVDVSSGPESLDPVPAPGKEDEFLWDDFHPAGFQDNENVTLHLTAEAAYQALLDGKTKQGAECPEGDSSLPTHPPQVSFRLDTACLEDSGDELEGAKLDPLLVTTQIVQAEVDCMSLTSLPTDTSLPEDVSQFIKRVREEDSDKKREAEAPAERAVKASNENVSAEELSGPVSILDVSQVEVSTTEPNAGVELKRSEAGPTENFSEKLDEVSTPVSEVKTEDDLKKENPQEELVKKEESKQEQEIKENVKDAILPEIPTDMESSKAPTSDTTSQTSKTEPEECVTNSSDELGNLKSISQPKLNSVSEIDKNGDAGGVSDETPAVSVEPNLSAEANTSEGSPDDSSKSTEDKKSLSFNSSDKVTTDHNTGDQDVNIKDSVCEEPVGQ